MLVTPGALRDILPSNESLLNSEHANCIIHEIQRGNLCFTRIYISTIIKQSNKFMIDHHKSLLINVT